MANSENMPLDLIRERVKHVNDALPEEHRLMLVEYPFGHVVVYKPSGKQLIFNNDPDSDYWPTWIKQLTAIDDYADKIRRNTSGK